MILKKASQSALLAAAVLYMASAVTLTGCKSDSAAAPDTSATGTNAAGQPTSHRSSMVDRAQRNRGADSGGK